MGQQGDYKVIWRRLFRHHLLFILALQVSLLLFINILSNLSSDISFILISSFFPFLSHVILLIW